MRPIKTPKEIIESVAKHAQITVAKLATEIGYERPQVLYDIIKGKTRDISSAVATKIIAKFPEINQAWLLTGKGDMLTSGREQDSKSNYLVPFYDADAAAGGDYEVEMAATPQVGKLDVGYFLRDSTAALRVYGNSMVPGYPAGSVVGLRLHLDSFIVPSKVYVVETQSNRYIKRLFYNKDKTALRCISDNNNKHEGGQLDGQYCYPEFEIPLKDVKRIFSVIGVIKRNESELIA